MRAHDQFHSANVIAAFENQDDADEAVLQLRLLGLSDDHIGYYSQHPTRGLVDLIAHDRGLSGAIIGGVVGTVLGLGLAQLLNRWSAMSDALSDYFGLAVTLGTFGALFLGFVGWWIGTGVERRSVRAPAVDPHVGAFILAVSAGDLRGRAWAVIHQHGGHELPAAATMPHPIAV